jgi:hypothetical protein
MVTDAILALLEENPPLLESQVYAELIRHEILAELEGVGEELIAAEKTRLAVFYKAVDTLIYVRKLGVVYSGGEPKFYLTSRKSLPYLETASATAASLLSQSMIVQ